MSAIINIDGVQSTIRVAPPGPTHYGRSSASVPAAGIDTVELSRFGRALARAAEQSSLSVARIRAIRAEIEGGTFETPERISGTIDRLVNLIG